jgi:hypothetical protein
MTTTKIETDVSVHRRVQPFCERGRRFDFADSSRAARMSATKICGLTPHDAAGNAGTAVGLISPIVGMQRAGRAAGDNR